MNSFYRNARLFAVVLSSFIAAPTFAQGWTDDGTVVRLTTISDAVGIGTTSPLTKLHIIGSGTGTNMGRVRVASSDDQAGISLFSNNLTSPRLWYQCKS